jgi:hypothetical protein
LQLIIIIIIIITVREALMLQCKAFSHACRRLHALKEELNLKAIQVCQM